MDDKIDELIDFGLKRTPCNNFDELKDKDLFIYKSASVGVSQANTIVVCYTPDVYRSETGVNP